MRSLIVMLAVAVAATGLPARGEMVEEIVAWVNGDIITKADLETEEQVATSEGYRSLTGAELDRYLEQIRKGLLQTLIDNKLLAQRARTIFNLGKMRDALWDNFMKQQGIEDEAELLKTLAQQGFSEESFKDRLIEMYAPDEVLAYEVGGRTAASDVEVRQYYNDHPEQFEVPGKVTIREIVLLADTPQKQASRQAEAEQVLEKARHVEAFEELAREVSEAGTASNGGLLGPLERTDLNEDLARVAFSLEPGAVSDLLVQPYGYHIITVVERVDDRELSLAEIRDQLEGALDNKKIAEGREVYMQKLRGEAEWCVKPDYRDRLAVPSPECKSM